MSPIRTDFSVPSGNAALIADRIAAQMTPKTMSAKMGRKVTLKSVVNMVASMPECDRDPGYDPEDDGPQWDEGRDLMGEADFADFLDEGEDGDDE